MKATKTLSMSIDGIEHAVEYYNDDSGYGLTLCGKGICPHDLGPRFERVACIKCVEKVKK